MVTGKIFPFVCCINHAVKIGLVEQDQSNEKEEAKKNNETFSEKKFTFFFPGENSIYLSTTPTHHNTIYINNYKSSFYGSLSTPPPDGCFDYIPIL